MFKLWQDAGFPMGKTPFASFPEWAEIIGVVMLANVKHMYEAFDPVPIDGEQQAKTKVIPAGWGDPCLPWNDEFSESVTDECTAAMTALFIVCRSEFVEGWVKNKAIIACVAKYQTLINAGEDESEKEQSQGAAVKDQETKYKYRGPEDKDTAARLRLAKLIAAVS